MESNMKNDFREMNRLRKQLGKVQRTKLEKRVLSLKEQNRQALESAQLIGLK